MCFARFGVGSVGAEEIGEVSRGLVSIALGFEDCAVDGEVKVGGFASGLEDDVGEVGDGRGWGVVGGRVEWNRRRTEKPSIRLVRGISKCFGELVPEGRRLLFDGKGKCGLEEPEFVMIVIVEHGLCEMVGRATCMEEVDDGEGGLDGFVVFDGEVVDHVLDFRGELDKGNGRFAGSNRGGA